MDISSSFPSPLTYKILYIVINYIKSLNIYIYKLTFISLHKVMSCIRHQFFLLEMKIYLDSIPLFCNINRLNNE